MDNRLLAKKASHNRVLLVDDDPTMLRLLSTWLEVAGYEVIQTDNGRDALRLIEEKCPDYLITDWEMPQIDGPTLCHMARGMVLPHYMYAVILTGRKESGDVIAALDSGADDFLTKPVQKTELLVRLAAGARVIELERTLSVMANSDVLTGLNTRRTFFEHFEREWDRSKRHKNTLSCVMLDIDYFKRINDVYGHAVGDSCLQMVARMLTENCRSSDVVCRFAGDEFVAILPDSDFQQAITWSERLRERIRCHTIRVGDVAPTLTATCGIAELGVSDDEVKSPEDLLDRADQALLMAKQAGRDRVAVYGMAGAGAQPGQSETCSELFRSSTAADVMVPCKATLQRGEPIQRAVAVLMQQSSQSVVIVDESGKFCGVLAETDLTPVVQSGADWTRPIHEFVANNFVAFDGSDPADQVFEYLSRGSVSRAVVLQAGCPVGIVGMASLMQWVQQTQAASSDSQSNTEASSLDSLAESLLSEILRLRDELAVESSSPSENGMFDAAAKIQELATHLKDACQTNG